MNFTSIKLVYVAIFLLLGSFCKAQSLESQFKAIGLANDMMGGSLVVFCENGVLETLSYGTADLVRDLAVTANTKYRIASISKTITAIAVMQVVEEGLLALDENISDILEYTVSNPLFPEIAITPRMLLSHTSSLIDGPTYSSFLGATISNDPIPNLSELLTTTGSFYSSDQFNSSVPGSYFNYANINFVILATLVEKVSGQRFDIYCKQNISDPLEIEASFNVNDLSDLDQLAVLYRKPSGVWTPQKDNYGGIPPTFTNLEDYVPGTNGGRFGPQGGFRCSAIDLSKIFQVLMNLGTYDDVTLLSEASCEALLSNQWTYDGTNGNNYGGLFLSWGLGVHRSSGTPGNDIVLPESTSMLGHPGEAYGLVSDAYFDPVRHLGFVFITNGVGIGYSTSGVSAFYTVEQEVFEAIEDNVNISECETTLSQAQLEQQQYSIYPNPANDLIFVPTCENNNACNIAIYSLDGRLILQTYLKYGEKSVDLSALQQGVYIFKQSTVSSLLIKN